MNILLGIIALTVLALAHEGGHFLFARLAGVPVEEFALGFGPALLSIKGKGTVFRLNLIPVLAYVKIKGMEPGDEIPDGFNTKSFWHRALILFGGPLFSILFALIVFFFVFGLSPMPTTTIAEVLPDSPAQVAGLLPGDKILEVNEQKVNGWQDAVMKISQYDPQEGPLILKIERNGEVMLFQIEPQFNSQENRYVIGISSLSIRRSFSQVFSSALLYFWQMLSLVFYSLGMLFTGQVGIKDFAGPVGMVTFAAQQAQSGILNLLAITGVFSMALGAFNLIPFPGLDGGHLAFLLYEKISKRKLSPNVQNIINSIGFMILLIFLFVVTWIDISRL